MTVNIPPPTSGPEPIRGQPPVQPQPPIRNEGEVLAEAANQIPPAFHANGYPPVRVPNNPLQFEAVQHEAQNVFNALGR